ncbi:MAG: hypothetical protein EAZ55_06965 [Cytophagales bacterium]|nr:MAG: hypothetical protein EAZ55_06965 [Cytophagales bacterium]
MLSFWYIVSLEASLVLVLLYIPYHFFFAQDTFFARNRYYLLLASLLALIVPFFHSSVGYWSMQEVYYFRLDRVSLTLQTVEENMVLWSSDWLGIVFFIYGLVAFILLILYLYKLFSIYELIENNPVEYRRDYQLVHTSSHLPTFSFLTYIFWDKKLQLSEQEADRILSHELRHIRGRHSYDILWLEVLKIVFWYNPVIYLYDRALRLQHEFIADNLVLTERNIKDYTQLIVKSLFDKLKLNLVNGFNQIQVKTRIKMLNKKRTADYQFFKILFVLPFLGLLWAMTAPEPLTPPLMVPVKVGGGIENFQKMFAKVIQEKVRMPKNMTYKVDIVFEVSSQGGVLRAEVVGGNNARLNDEILEAFLKASSRYHWLPAHYRGKPVKQKGIFPVILENKK